MIRHIYAVTRSQFAIAVMAPEKWVENAARLLNRKFRYTREESVWLGLVRELNFEAGLPLARAAEVADEALGLVDEKGEVVVGRKEGSSAAIVIDMPRFRSSHGAALSSALTLGGTRRRGRPRVRARRKGAVLDNASRYGVDLDLLREGLKLTVAERMQRADENAAFVRAMRKPK
ncbi:MAG TPA: hypothetical protein VNC11_11480 [Gemmatimonadaceae bacterium]|jgi:hypothetical protein|nr:hypothetical protein [Gemmatimonadaceae bacterium]